MFHGETTFGGMGELVGGGHGVYIVEPLNSRRRRIHSFALSESTEGLTTARPHTAYAAASCIPFELRKRIDVITTFQASSAKAVEGMPRTLENINDVKCDNGFPV
jgi:hypothetical protein